jgi:hypothetical protein
VYNAAVKEVHPMRLLTLVALAALPLFSQGWVWEAGEAGSDEVLSQGERVRVLTRGPLTIRAYPLREAVGSLATLVTIRNVSTDTRVDVEPERFRLLYNDKGQLTAVRSRHPEDLADRTWSLAAGAMAAGLAGFLNPRGEVIERHQGTVTDASGRSATFNGTTRRVDPDATAAGRAQAQAAEARRRASALSDSIMDSALLGTTLMPGEQVVGWVYFQKTKMSIGVLEMQFKHERLLIPLQVKGK